MEVYVLDSLLRRTAVFDVFESMIWTERWQDVGDFELHISSSFDTRSQFANGVRIAINESYRVMTVETVEDTTDVDGKAMLKITGHSLENVLKDRVAAHTPIVSNLTDQPTWNITETPGNVARVMVFWICSSDGTYAHGEPLDKIPFLSISDVNGQAEAYGTPGWTFTDTANMFGGSTVSDILTPGTLPEPADEINWRQDVTQNLYDAVKAVCDLYDLGFRILRNFDNSQLVFNIYSGSDRTTRQTDLPAVVFANNLDNLQNTTEFNSIDQSKNVAFVYSAIHAPVTVYGEGVDTDVSAFDRRVMAIDASSEIDATMTETEMINALTQAGRQALNQNRTSSYFDGEINQDSSYSYGVDYQMGDLVELRNIDGVVSYKRVSEQIFVSDSQGERSYPTLSMDAFVGVNAWLSYGNKTTVWLDFDLDATAWADM